MRDVRWSSPAGRDMDRLAKGVPRACAAIVEFVYGDLRDEPARVGVELRGALSGSWRARRGPYRVVYRFDDAEVVIEHVAHQADVCRLR